MRVVQMSIFQRVILSCNSAIYKQYIWLCSKVRSKSKIVLSLSKLAGYQLILSLYGKYSDLKDLDVQIISLSSLIQNLRSEASKSYDAPEQLHEIQESVRLAFLNSFLDFAGNYLLTQ